MLRTAIPVRSLAEAAGVAAQVVAAAGADGDRHLWLDLRPDQVIVTLQTHAAATVTARDVAIAGQLTAALGARGLPTDPDPPGARRSVQSLEIDALDTPSTTRRASPPGRAAGDV